ETRIVFTTHRAILSWCSLHPRWRRLAFLTCEEIVRWMCRPSVQGIQKPMDAPRTQRPEGEGWRKSPTNGADQPWTHKGVRAQRRAPALQCLDLTCQWCTGAPGYPVLSQALRWS